MQESQTQIDKTLQIAGEELIFPSFIILGIPGELIYNVQNFDSPYDIMKHDFEFQVSAKDFKDNAITKDLIFTYSNSIYIFSFKIKDYIIDLSGWVHLLSEVTGVSNV